jgi:hypothetical protein
MSKNITITLSDGIYSVKVIVPKGTKLNQLLTMLRSIISSTGK